MQNITAQMALLPFMMTGKDQVAVPSGVYCNGLIQAKVCAKTELNNTAANHHKVYDFPETTSKK